MADTATLTPPPPDSAEADDPARRPVVTLLPGGHRRAEAGHPWIYSNEIAMEAAAIVLRNDSPARALEGLAAETRVAMGQIDDPVFLEENGVAYEADVLAGQKTGWFFDQRDNRTFIAALARDARVLDLYCYSGGFSLAAA